MKKYGILIFALLSACSSVKTVKQPEISPTFSSVYFLSMGETALFERNTMQASRYYQLALKEDPNSWEITKRLLLCYDVLASTDEQYNQNLAAASREALDKGLIYAETYSYLATAEIRMKNYKEALVHLKKAIALEPEASLYYKQFLIEQQESGKKDIKLLYKAFDVAKSSQQDLALMLLLQINSEKSPQTEHYLQLAYERFSDRRFLEIYARYLADNQRYTSLLELLQSDWEKTGEKPPRQLYECFLHYYDEHDYSVLLGYFDLFLALEDEDINSALLSIAESCKDYPKAIRAMQILLKQSDLSESRSSLFKGILAGYYYQVGEIETSVKLLCEQKTELVAFGLVSQDHLPTENLAAWLSELQQKCPYSLNLTLAKVSILKKDDVQAAAYLRQAMQENGENKKNIALLWLELNRLDEARTVFALADSSTVFENFAGMYYFTEKKYAQAEKLLEKVLADSSSLTLTTLAAVYEKNNKEKAAISLLEKATAKYPEDASVLNALGYTLVENTTDYNEAEVYLKKAIILNPEADYILDSIAWLHYKKGDYAKALDYMNLPLQNGIKDSVMAYHLGEIYYKLKKKEDAKRYFRFAVILRGDEEGVEKAKIALKKYFGE